MPAYRPTCCYLLIAFLACCPVALANDWPQWQGPGRDGQNRERGLLQQWPEGGPPLVWTYRDCGEGYSSAAIVDGRLYTLGAREGQTLLIVLDVTGGAPREVYATPLGASFEDGTGNGPRSTPTVVGDAVYSLTARGVLTCVRAENGQIVWQRTMQEFGGVEPPKRMFWGFSESVLVDGDQVVSTPAGESGPMVALDRYTGELRWQTDQLKTGPETSIAQYASILPITHQGQRQYVQMLRREIVGVAPEDGRLLWSVPRDGPTAVVSIPIYHEGYIYVSSAYGAGCMAIRLDDQGRATEVYSNKIMQNHHGGMVHLGNHVFGFSGGNGGHRGWICQELQTGEEVWRNKSDLGKGAIAYADGMLYCQSEDDGELVLIEASRDGWREHGRFTIPERAAPGGRERRVWAHPVIVNGRLYVRDQNLLYCYDISKP